MMHIISHFRLALKRTYSPIILISSNYSHQISTNISSNFILFYDTIILLYNKHNIEEDIQFNNYCSRVKLVQKFLLDPNSDQLVQIKTK